MDGRVVFRNAQVIMPYRIFRNGFVSVAGGKVEAVGEGTPDYDNCEYVDCGGNYLSAGFIELHSHGCAGFDYMDGTEEAFRACARDLASHGVTLVYPTVTTGSDANFAASFAAYEKTRDSTGGAAFGGLHLEGPYFAYAMRGAQDPRFLKNPVREEYTAMLDRYPDIKRWSAAPELPGGIELGRELRRRGVVAAMGHTDGLFEELMTAYENGYTHMTHFYSAMSSIRRINAFRHSGAVEIGYMLDDVTIEIIADGVHLPPELLRQVFKLKAHDKISLISDSMRGAGLPEGTITKLGSLKDGQEVIIEDGVAKLKDRSAFAGSVATAERLIRTVTLKAGLELADAVRMMTLNPAKVMGEDGRKGSLSAGKDADLIVFDPDINIKLTVIGGETVFLSK